MWRDCSTELDNEILLVTSCYFRSTSFLFLWSYCARTAKMSSTFIKANCLAYVSDGLFYCRLTSHFLHVYHSQTGLRKDLFWLYWTLDKQWIMGAAMVYENTNVRTATCCDLPWRHCWSSVCVCMCACVRVCVCVCVRVASGWRWQASYIIKSVRRTRGCLWRPMIAPWNLNDAFNCDSLKTQPARSPFALLTYLLTYFLTYCLSVLSGSVSGQYLNKDSNFDNVLVTFADGHLQ